MLHHVHFCFYRFFGSDVRIVNMYHSHFVSCLSSSQQAFSVFFVCVAFTSDIICLLFIPVQWLFFAASTYVWVQYVWHTGKAKECFCPLNFYSAFVFVCMANGEYFENSSVTFGPLPVTALLTLFLHRISWFVCTDCHVLHHGFLNK